MYYQNYEDYMRSILGYPRDTEDTYQMNYYEDERNSNYWESMYQENKDLEDLYPEIYKSINPFVVDVCSRCREPITKDTLEEMVEEIYRKIENNNEVMVNINIVNDSAIISREAENNRSTSQNTQNMPSVSKQNYTKNNLQNIPNESLKRGIDGQENRETRHRRPNNHYIRDLIKILILDRLLGNFPNRPNRPTPPRPPRPPMPPRPPRPQPRGNYDDYLRF